MTSAGSHMELVTEPGHGPIYKTLTHALPTLLPFWSCKTYPSPLTQGREGREEVNGERRWGRALQMSKPRTAKV